jgi:hypothetical protein
MHETLLALTFPSHTATSFLYIRPASGYHELQLLEADSILPLIAGNSRTYISHGFRSSAGYSHTDVVFRRKC